MIEDTVWKDGVGIYSLSPPNPYSEFYTYHYPWWSSVDTWQVEIPEDWEAGTYEVHLINLNQVSSIDSVVSFTVPALADTTLPVLTFITGGWGSLDTEIPSGGLLTVDATNSTGQNAYFAVVDKDYIIQLENGEDAQEYNFNINITCSASPVPTYTTRDHYTGPKLEDDPSSWWKYGATFPIGTTTVTCTGTDEDGNVGTASFTVTVIYTEPEVPSEPETPSESDIIPPEVLVPNNIVVNTENQDGKVVSFNPQAVDNIDELLTPTCNPQSGSLFPIGTTTVTCTATDSAGNTNTNSFTVTILDFDGFVIPDWISDIAEWWHNDTINDDSFLNAIEYLIQHDVIVVPPTDIETESSPTVPSWFKINAGFWASGQIDDETFVNGLQYLIQIGLIQV